MAIAKMATLLCALHRITAFYARQITQSGGGA